MKALSNRIASLPPSAALSVDLRSKALVADGRDIVSFCVGEPDFIAPAAATEADVRAVLSGNTKYTNASGTASLRTAVCTALARDCSLTYTPDEIAVTSSAKYAVYAAVMTLCDPGDEVVLPAPYYTSYDPIVRLVGAVPVIVPCSQESGWKLTADALRAAVTSRTKAVLLNNPNNPTGAVYSRRELTALADVCRKHDLFVIADEIYSRLVYTAEPFCAAASVSEDMRSRTVTVNGVSKAYAMTGFRIGYAAAARPITRGIAALLSHTTGSPNTAAQAAAAAALASDQADTERMRRTFQNRRDVLCEALSAVPHVQFTVPQGAFYVMLDVRALLGSSFETDAAFAQALLERAGVAVVPCTDYGARGYIRLSYTLPEERMLEGVCRLRQLIETEGSTHVHL